MKQIAACNEHKKMTDFMDKYFLIGSTYEMKNGTQFVDPGDALQRTGYVAIAELLSAQDEVSKGTAISNFKVRLLSHKIGPGLYVRHRFSTKWCNNLNVTSGDQMRPVVIAMGLMGMRSEVLLIIRNLLFNFGFYWNTRDTGEITKRKKKTPDPVMPDHWSMYIRALGPVACTLLMPLLYFGDLWNLLSTAWATFVYPYQRLQNCDQLNRIAMLTQGIIVYPTFLSRLAHRIFRDYRPVYHLEAEDYVTATHTHRVRYWQPANLQNKKNVVDYINESYFWAPADPPIHKVWYAVSKKYWEVK